MAEPHHDGHHATADHQYGPTPPGAGFEHTDANTRIIAHFLLWLGVAAVIVHIGMWGMFAFFVEQRREVGEPQFPLAAGTDGRTPPEPRLQQFPLWEHQTFRRREDALLQGGADPALATPRVPIEEAMRMTIEGLPVREPAEGLDTDVRERRPAGSSSGRTFQIRRQ